MICWNTFSNFFLSNDIVLFEMTTKTAFQDFAFFRPCMVIKIRKYIIEENGCPQV